VCGKLASQVLGAQLCELGYERRKIRRKREDGEIEEGEEREGNEDCMNGERTESRNKDENSVALVRKTTIPTERPSLVGEVSGNY
jgi:hypothetical protein